MAKLRSKQLNDLENILIDINNAYSEKRHTDILINLIHIALRSILDYLKGEEDSRIGK
jgi:hypothetical protein